MKMKKICELICSEDGVVERLNEEIVFEFLEDEGIELNEQDIKDIKNADYDEIAFNMKEDVYFGYSDLKIDDLVY